MLQLPISTRLSPSKPQKSTLALWENSTDVCEILHPPECEKQGIFRAHCKKRPASKRQVFCKRLHNGQRWLLFFGLVEHHLAGVDLGLAQHQSIHAGGGTQVGHLGLHIGKQLIIALGVDLFLIFLRLHTLTLEHTQHLYR